MANKTIVDTIRNNLGIIIDKVETGTEIVGCEKFLEDLNKLDGMLYALKISLEDLP